MRLGLVSDIHGAHQALRRALSLMSPIDRLVCLGDSIRQSQFCNETIGILRAENAVVLRGNHEDAFFESPAAHAPDVDPALSDWLRVQPAQTTLNVANRRLLLAHSTPWPSNHAYVPPTHRDFARFATTARDHGADAALYGHTHMPVVLTLDNVLVINPGSVGEGYPTQTGFMRTCAVLDLTAMSAQIIDLD